MLAGWESMTIAFIGDFTAGSFGAVLAAIGVLLPGYALVIAPARTYRDSLDNPLRRLLVDVLIAAATAAVVALAITLGRRAVFDMTTAMIAAAAFVCLVYARRIPPAVVILSAVALGLSLTP